ncbi:efflux transporter outer membrane subunit [Paraburkholderia metrosideri]|jgi:NodT family efflux transporter outer membrane factor (OMF) lipoprotein|uniref:Antibiotic efflux pump outer membrane protein ArpC n=1 Tax=Paraburkholderia metrosideri TaxID=580937 RepID=A0ABM8NCI4_9BURK|nr:efflux transporter outer membrane subunit [Paraburkholderia metrosideri]CAD6517404.1 Antibiotic efflux pump outer membrane protein ArpC [Paraburkholderia metrosideri]
MHRALCMTACAMAAMLTACSFAPVYHAPALPQVSAFKEAPPPSGVWHYAQWPAKVRHDEWWKAFGDPSLDRFETQLAQNNPQLAAAVARHDQSSADLDTARSGLFPSLTLDVDSEQNRQSDYRPLRGSSQPDTYGAHTVTLGVSYELDLWGRVRNEVRAGAAQQAASADDLAAVKLLLQADLANAYFETRGLDEQADLLTRTQIADAKALTLTKNRHAGGISSELDVYRARTELENVAADQARVRRARAAAEHALATLAGVPASLFTLPVAQTSDAVPDVPAGVPSALLQRRPDIAAAEQRAVAANYAIGVARAAWFPDISLGLAGGFQSDDPGNWLSAPASFWSLGPELAVDLFDGGRRNAMDHRARAIFDERSADYRQVALQAFREVEDQLANVRELRSEAQHESAAADDATGALALATGQYRDGAVSYLDVVAAQTSALDAQRSLIQARTGQLLAAVNLIRALGGGWD